MRQILMTAHQTRRPLVSIGMSLYNNAATIERVIKSIQCQTWADIEIVISDDDSTDDTFKICSDLAQQDDRIKLFRQDDNLYYQNFRFGLEKASADFFMWGAGDDHWRPLSGDSDGIQLETLANLASRAAFPPNRISLSVREGNSNQMDNASTESAEGNHLEPCQKWGHAYLQATRNALEAAGVAS